MTALEGNPELKAAVEQEAGTTLPQLPPSSKCPHHGGSFRFPCCPFKLLKGFAMVLLVMLSAASIAFSSLLIASSIVLSMVRVDENGNEEYPSAAIALCVLIAVASMELMIISLVVRVTSLCFAPPSRETAIPSAIHYAGDKPLPSDEQHAALIGSMESPVTPSAPVAAGPRVAENHGGISYVYNAFFGSYNQNDWEYSQQAYANGDYMPLAADEERHAHTEAHSQTHTAQTGYAAQPVSGITMI
jgi:hypothetical protein